MISGLIFVGSLGVWGWLLALYAHKRIDRLEERRTS
jgi:hypothetical protein